MTNPESIVVDLAHAKLLKEAGFQQESHWFWNKYPHNTSAYEWYLECPADRDIDLDILDEIAAPTCEEILRRLPKEIGDCVLDAHWFAAHEGCWRVCYEVVMGEKHEMPYNTLGETLANAAAAMYVYLAKNKLPPKP